jgi:glycosyltransferase involved in cell wall biosynthesis
MFRAVLHFEADVIVGASAPYLHQFFPIWARRFGNKKPFIYLGALHINGPKVSAPILKGIHAAEAYIALTDYERRFLISQGIKPKKIHLVGPGIELKKFKGANRQSVREKHGIGKAPFIIFVGRQASNKGIDTLLFAMQKVWCDVPDTFVLIAGARTGFSKQLDQIIDGFPAQKKKQIIQINGFTEDEKPDLFAAGDIFVTISRSESFGIVYLEAWASGMPVIGGRIGAVQSVINEGEDGLLVACGDANQLANAILYLLQNETERQRLAKNGYDKVQAEHSWEVVTQKVRHVYESVV